jgi:lipid II:glycine glycyltransferase (peptidoglycan interpeptide bridge formation enzyme)
MIREVTEKEKQAFNKATIHPLQSWEWGEFRAKHGNTVKRYAQYKEGKLVSPFQLVYSHIPYTPFTIGTVIRSVAPTKEFLEFIKTEAKRINAIFVKFEPYVATQILNSKSEILNKYPKTKSQITNTFKTAGAVSGKTFFTPTSFWIDLTKSEEELLASFHPKTRYNIRLAQKKGVTVVEDNSDEAFEEYIKLFFETTKRQNYFMHTEMYHRMMWDVLHKLPVSKGLPPVARLMTAKYENEVVVAWIVFVWKDKLYYPYGGSTDKFKNVMAPNLMMWETILYGKKLGLSTFDLWGREEGKGFTKFKEGYNPEVVEFIGTRDLPTSPLYLPYTIAEKVRWWFLRIKGKFIN